MCDLVSVVITTYKRETAIVQQAIDSVVNQTYSPIEVLLIDDNGKNSEYGLELKKLCSNYSNVNYLPNEQNSGAQVSRNNGILHSKGKFVAFLDDDDIWRNDKIEVQIKLFSDESIGMVYCDGYSFFDSDLSKTGVFREASIFSTPISHKLELFNDYIGSTSQAVVRRSCFEKIGMFDCEMPARQDYEMWLRISNCFTIVGSPEKLLYYRVHSGERISTNWKKCRRSYELILQKYSCDYSKNRYAKAKLLLRVFDMSMRLRDYIKALKFFFYALSVNPVCVYDVIHRKISKKSFSDYYTIPLLMKRGIIEKGQEL